MKTYNEFYNKNCGKIKIKRAFDIIVSFILIVVLSPVMIYIAYRIKKDSKGPVIFRQLRITKFGKPFMIFKFRTMEVGSEKINKLTVRNDKRVTKIGEVLRKYRLDELPQLFNIFVGDMSFVGARPEVPAYVEKYSKDMKKTLWLQAGVTSEASIGYKDEADMIEKYAKIEGDVDKAYLKYVLPKKMEYNIRYIEKFSLIKDIKILIQTILAVIR